jgi:hypothetical protein
LAERRTLCNAVDNIGYDAWLCVQENGSSCWGAHRSERGFGLSEKGGQVLMQWTATGQRDCIFCLSPTFPRKRCEKIQSKLVAALPDLYCH